MLSKLLGEDWPPIDMWHGSNLEETVYLDGIPKAYFKMWNGEELEWVRKLYRSEEFQAAERRWIQINKDLETERPGPIRRKLIDEASALKGPSWVVRS